MIVSEDDWQPLLSQNPLLVRWLSHPLSKIAPSSATPSSTPSFFMGCPPVVCDPVSHRWSASDLFPTTVVLSLLQGLSRALRVAQWLKNMRPSRSLPARPREVSTNTNTLLTVGRRLFSLLFVGLWGKSVVTSNCCLPVGLWLFKIDSVLNPLS